MRTIAGWITGESHLPPPSPKNMRLSPQSAQAIAKSAGFPWNRCITPIATLEHLRDQKGIPTYLSKISLTPIVAKSLSKRSGFSIIQDFRFILKKRGILVRCSGFFLVFFEVVGPDRLQIVGQQFPQTNLLLGSEVLWSLEEKPIWPGKGAAVVLALSRTELPRSGSHRWPFLCGP